MYDPFKTSIASNPEDQQYLQHAYDKWRKRKHRTPVEITVFIHRNGKRRHRILAPGAFKLSMIRVGESCHDLASFYPSGIVHIEREFRTETEWYREYLKQLESAA